MRSLFRGLFLTAAFAYCALLVVVPGEVAAVQSSCSPIAIHDWCSLEWIWFQGAPWPVLIPGCPFPGNC